MIQELPEELSARELEILELVATGATNQQIAQALSISINTVKAHLRNVFAKLMVESRTEATLCAIQHGLIEVASPVEDGDAAPEPDQEAAPLPSRVRCPSSLRPIPWRGLWPFPNALPWRSARC